MPNRQILAEPIVEVIGRVQNDDIKALAQVIYGLVQQINSVLANEDALREAVLNGHAANHDADHEWIAERRAQAKVRAEIDAWAIKAMAAEATAAAEKKADKRTARDTVIREVVAAAIGAGTVLAVLIMRGAL